MMGKLVTVGRFQMGQSEIKIGVKNTHLVESSESHGESQLINEVFKRKNKALS